MATRPVKNIPEIIPATLEHAASIAANIREADREELRLLGWEPGRVLRLSLAASFIAWTGTVNGVPICMFGVAPGGFIGEGRPWMIGARDLDRHAMIFLRRCKGQVEEMLSITSLMVNYVHTENRRAIQWLRWLGFEIEEAQPYGPFEAPFHRFTMRR